MGLTVRWFGFGPLVLGVMFGATALGGCAEVTSAEKRGSTQSKLLAPQAAIRSAASSETKARYGIVEWRIVRGKKDMFMTGYDENGKAVKGISFGFAGGTNGEALLHTKLNDGTKFAAVHGFSTQKTVANKSLAKGEGDFVRTVLEDTTRINAIFKAKQAVAPTASAACGADLSEVVQRTLQCMGGKARSKAEQAACVAAAKKAAASGATCKGQGTTSSGGGAAAAAGSAAGGAAGGNAAAESAGAGAAGGSAGGGSCSCSASDAKTSTAAGATASKSGAAAGGGATSTSSSTKSGSDTGGSSSGGGNVTINGDVIINNGNGNSTKNTNGQTGSTEPKKSDASEAPKKGESGSTEPKKSETTAAETPKLDPASIDPQPGEKDPAKPADGSDIFEPKFEETTGETTDDEGPEPKAGDDTGTGVSARASEDLGGGDDDKVSASEDGKSPFETGKSDVEDPFDGQGDLGEVSASPTTGEPTFDDAGPSSSEELSTTEDMSDFDGFASSSEEVGGGAEPPQDTSEGVAEDPTSD